MRQILGRLPSLARWTEALASKWGRAEEIGVFWGVYWGLVQQRWLSQEWWCSPIVSGGFGWVGLLVDRICRAKIFRMGEDLPG